MQNQYGTFTDRCWNLFSSCNSRRSRPSRRGAAHRRLIAEALESRLALSGTPFPASEAIAEGSLAAYLAESPEQGPALPAAAEVGTSGPAVLDEGAIQAADALADVLAFDAPPTVGEFEAEGEEESVSPTLLTLTVQRIDGGFIRLAGTLSDDDPGMVNVVFGDLFAGYNALSDSVGYFETYVFDPGFGGFVSASATDGQGNHSNVLTSYLI